MSTKNSQLAKHEASFRYQDKEITYCFWSKDAQQIVPDTVLFLGTGQIGKIPKWVAGMAPSGIVVVEGLPHWHSDPSAHDIQVFTRLYTESAFQAVLNTFKVSRMHVIGTSQATPGTIWLANDMPEKVGNIALVLPMGLTTNILGKTEKERFKELRKRSIRTVFQPGQSPLRDIRNLYVSALLAKIVFSGIANGSTVNKYSKGISQDMLEDFKLLIANQKTYNRHVSLFVGSDDRIFPIHEIKQTLTQAALEDVYIRLIPNASHSSLALKASQPIIENAVHAVRHTR